MLPGAGFLYVPRIVEFDNRRAVLHCRGDEDRATQGARRTGFTRAIKAERDVVVDLSELVFADSSLMLDLAALARRLRKRELAVRLRAPQPQILKLLELTGVKNLPGIVLERGVVVERREPLLA